MKSSVAASSLSSRIELLEVPAQFVPQWHQAVLMIGDRFLPARRRASGRINFSWSSSPGDTRTLREGLNTDPAQYRPRCRSPNRPFRHLRSRRMALFEPVVHPLHRISARIRNFQADVHPVPAICGAPSTGSTARKSSVSCAVFFASPR